MRLNLLVLIFLVLAGIATFSCSGKPGVTADSQIGTLGTAEVVARLVEIPGPFPPNDLYNYAYVLKYRVLRVHRGEIEGDEILVGHYNPLKPRSTVQDENSGKVGGSLENFKPGEVHRMALEVPIDQHWMGGIIDKYFSQKGVRYWAVWTNLESD